MYLALSTQQTTNIFILKIPNKSFCKQTQPLFKKLSGLYKLTMRKQRPRIKTHPIHNLRQFIITDKLQSQANLQSKQIYRMRNQQNCEKLIKLKLMYKMRHQQKYSTRLQKISETSSPSKQQLSPLSPIQTISLKSRINPANLTSSYLKFKRFQQEKQKRGFQLQSIRAQCQNHSNKGNNQLEQTKKVQTILQKNSKISDFQERIIKKKMELTLLQDCFQNRSQLSADNSTGQIFGRLFGNTLKLCSASKLGRKAYLDMVLTYSQQRKKNPENAFKLLVEWVVKIVKQIFQTISRLLKFPSPNSN